MLSAPHFPSEAELTETKRHLELRTLPYQLLKLELKGRAYLGSDQFVYWNAADARRCLAPGVFLRMGAPDVEVEKYTP